MRSPRFLRSALALTAALTLSSCSLKQVAMDAVADALSDPGGSSFTQDDDLQFVGEALPFALKLMETINDSVPEHVAMKLTLASGFTQYGMVFVEWPAEMGKYDDYEAYEVGRKRAGRFYMRANDYARTGLELLHPGFGDRVWAETDALLAEMTTDDVPLLYWCSASWLAFALSNMDDPEAFGVFPLASQMMKRAYELDPDWDNGAIHEILISLEPSLPMPGGQERALEHYERAVALQGGKKAGPHVALATSVALPNQDKARFVELLNLALAVDRDAAPELGLANDYAQQRAQWLLDHLDDLFLE